MTDNARGALFRPIVPHQHSRVTYAELFFDLVFVFAVTQISHTLLAHFTPLGALQVTLLFLAVWWVWVYTSWITNWLDPEKTPVRLLLFSLTLGRLVPSTPIPSAVDGRRAGAVALDPCGVRRARALVCHRLRRDAGRQDGLPVAIDHAVAIAGAHECGPHYQLAGDFSCVLDRRRVCAGPVAAGAVGDRALHRIYLARGTGLDSAILCVFRRPVGGPRL